MAVESSPLQSALGMPPVQAQYSVGPVWTRPPIFGNVGRKRLVCMVAAGAVVGTVFCPGAGRDVARTDGITGVGTVVDPGVGIESSWAGMGSAEGSVRVPVIVT